MFTLHLLRVADVGLNDETVAKKDMRILSIDGTQDIRAEFDTEGVGPSLANRAR